MAKKIALVLALIAAVFVLTSTLTGGVQVPAFSLPEARIAPADAPSPPLLRYVGTWEGSWEGVLPSRIVVEEIHPQWASLVYAWADHPVGTFKGGAARVRAKVVDGKLRWPFPGHFTFEVSEDGQTLVGFAKQPTDTAMIVMKRAKTAIASVHLTAPGP